MSCPETLRTQAYLDGELDGADAQAAAQHIETCPDCQAFSAQAAEVSDALRSTASRYRAPAGLRERILRQLDAASPAAPRARRGSFWRGAAAGSAITALAAALVGVMVILPPSVDSIAQAVTDAHTRAMIDDRSIEVVSSSHHTVKPWFAGRISVSPPVTDFQEEGFTLVGGRIDRIAGTRAAVVVYRHGNHQIDLFVWADADAELPGEAVRHGYRSVFWKRGDLDFAAVSDVNEEELQRFVTLVRSSRE